MPEIIIPKRKFTLEEVGLANQGLFRVDGELARRYNQVLKEVFGFDCELDSFRVDKRGLSPEVAEHLKKKYHKELEFGENYLNMRSANQFMVVVSPDQKSASLVAPQTSYEDGLYDLVHNLARHTIQDITQSEAMFGELENRISVYNSPYDLLQLRNIEVTLETLQGTVNAILELRKLSDKLGEGENALDPEYIGKMQELAKKTGDIRYRAVSNVFPVSKEVHCFYVEFFQGVHCLRNFRNKEGIRTLLVLHHQDASRDLGEQIQVRDLHDPKLLEDLHGYGFLKYSPELIDQRLQEIEDEALLGEGLDVASMQDFERKRRVVQLVKKLPKSYEELRDLKGMMREDNVRGMPAQIDKKSYETRLKLSQSADGDEIVEHMLAELDPSDVQRLYRFNGKKIVREFSSYPLERQRYIAFTILNKTQEVK